MDPVSISIVCGLVVGEFTRLAITRRQRARKTAIKKIHQHSQTTRRDVDRASDIHMRNVDRLLEK